MTIWDACDGPSQITPVDGTLFRMVESQEQIATLGYVDTLAEQALLEELLDGAKPAYPVPADTLHYLLKTPFRYPPLKWGSRFGGTHEPGIFYGGLSVRTTLAEAGYYRFVFWFSIDAPPPKPQIRSAHTLFSARYKTASGVRLQAPPFDVHLPELTHRTHYAPAQAVGTAMREAGVVAFEYRSARDRRDGNCVGLFTTDAFPERRPRETNQWICELSSGAVCFKLLGAREVVRFAVEDLYA